MHYYKRNLGDYAKKAGKLSMLQHGSYTLLIDACYDRERFPTLEEAIDWTWASTTAEVEAVQFVLRKFFTLVDGVYVQERIAEEIAEYHEKAETNKRIAIERETKRKEKGTKRAPSVNEPPPNQEPLTINQEPDTTLSALQAKTDPPSRLNGKTAMVEQVMAYLNLQARRNYRTKNPNGTPTAGAMVIAQRLKEGYTVEQCKDVIGEKSNQWMGTTEMDQYLTPQTLFRKSNFDKYLAEAEAAAQQ